MTIWGTLAIVISVVVVDTVPIPFLASAAHGSLFLEVILRLSNKEIKGDLLMRAFRFLF